MKVYALTLIDSIAFEEVRYFLNAQDVVEDWIAASENLVIVRTTDQTEADVLSRNFGRYLSRNKPEIEQVPFHLFAFIAGISSDQLQGALPRVVWERVLSWFNIRVDWENNAAIPIPTVPTMPRVQFPPVK